MPSKFTRGDKIVSIPRNEVVEVLDDLGDGKYTVIDGEGSQRMIYDNFWELETSPLVLHPGDRVRHKKTLIVGTIVGPAVDYGERDDGLLTAGTMPTPEPLYFIETSGDSDYIASSTGAKIVDARSVDRPNEQTTFSASSSASGNTDGLAKKKKPKTQINIDETVKMIGGSGKAAKVPFKLVRNSTKNGTGSIVID
ncbi:hypothetical protein YASMINEVIRUS_1222 [Yasminevirus sp. GU-2018]|uniref:Uncharacterized protein n=1 Tax=Yasminevirus sp. GU-2018 TaxID=2420051 RepID=A0A5K0UAQ5_9VIRU|nr:hypothetical protein YASMINEVIRUS_1222 [Yasminevirus sp. GU-2018]